MYHSRDIACLRADVRANCIIFIDLCKEAGLPVLITETVRDDEYQRYLAANGYCVKCTNIGGKVKVPKTSTTFRNEKANEGWKDCTAVSDDSVIYTLYDGKQNYVAKVNVASGAVELNVGNKNDKELVALMQSYADAFIEQYK